MLRDGIRSKDTQNQICVEVTWHHAPTEFCLFVSESATKLGKRKRCPSRHSNVYICKHFTRRTRDEYSNNHPALYTKASERTTKSRVAARMPEMNTRISTAPRQISSSQSSLKLFWKVCWTSFHCWQISIKLQRVHFPSRQISLSGSRTRHLFRSSS